MGTAIGLPDLYKMSDSDLRSFAKDMGLKLAPNLGRDKMIEAVQIENAKREKRIEAMVKTELEKEAAEKLGLTAPGDARPLPEDVAIIASKRFYVKFINREEGGKDGVPGADLRFTKGTFAFHLYDERWHVLPACVVAEDVQQIPEVKARLMEFFASAGLPSRQKGKTPSAEGMAIDVLNRCSIVKHCTTPIFRDKELPTGEKISVLAGSQGRFHLQIGSEAGNRPFGVVTDEKELKHATDKELVPLG